MAAACGTFRATSRSSCGSKARYTVPNAPAPSRERIWNRPMTVSGPFATLALGFSTSTSIEVEVEKPKASVANGPLTVIGRFQIRSRLGAGAFGTVYRAFDPQLEREVALKVPQAAAMEKRKSVERFLREAKAAAQLRHPHIVPIFDAGRDGPHYYIASAFIEGRTLSRAIDD